VTWLVAGPLIAAAVLALGWLTCGPYRKTLICELPGLLFILAAGKAHRSQARQIMASRGRHAEAALLATGAREAVLRSEITLHEYQDAARAARDPAVVALDAEMDAIVALPEATRTDRRPAGADLCAIHGAHVYSVSEPDCTICHDAPCR
jgi:hypothetical protein